MTPAAVVERCFEAALELCMALPAELPSLLVDLTVPASAAAADTAGGSALREQCRLHLEVLKYDEMKRRYDRECQAAAPGRYVPMTGALEAARSAVALQATLRLLAANAGALSWGLLSSDAAVLSPKSRLQRRADWRMRRLLERSRRDAEAARGLGSERGCWPCDVRVAEEEGMRTTGGCCVVS